MQELKQYDHRDDLIRDLNNLIGEGRGVEVGVFKGEFSRLILQNWVGTLYMVDVWKPLGGEYDDYANHKNHNDPYKNAIDNTDSFGDRGIMIRTNSKKASEMFEDESLDFVYIDANHSYNFVKEDIKIWFPKLRKGGIMSGHDYINIDWYNEPHWDSNGIDKPIFTYIYENGVEVDFIFSGNFGVNPAVDEFCKENDYKLNLTKEWFGTWWLIK